MRNLPKDKLQYNKCLIWKHKSRNWNHKNEVVNQQVDNLSITIHELEDKLKDMQLQNEQLQHEIAILEQQCYQNLFGDNLKKLVKVKQSGVFTPSELGQTMLVLFKKEKIRRIYITYGQIGHFH